MTALNKRRWRQFKHNRRAWYSLCIFLVLFGTSLIAEVIANDKPLIMSHNGSLWFPAIFSYTEEELGGELPIEALYWDPYVKEMIKESGGWMLWPPIPFSYHTPDMFIASAAPAPPSMRHWLGTDDAGKDTVARLIYGFRLSVLFGLILTLISGTFGIAMGALQGYFGGYIDLIGQRFVEVWTGLPMLLLLIVLASVVEPNFFWLLGTVAAFSWMTVVSVVRAEFLRTRNFDYVRAAKALGDNDFYIMFHHVLPNAMTAALTFLPFMLSIAVITLTSLDFLGFGLPAGSPSLGELLAQGKANLHAPWLGLTGFATLGVMLTLLIFISEGVRDAFDPRRTMSVSGAGQ